MRRRSRAGGPNAQAPKAGARKSRVAPKDARPRSSSAAHEETRVARLTRERDEALARQTATSEILRVISQSPTDVRPVFDGIVLTAARLLRSDLVLVLLCDGATYSHAAVASPDGPFEDLGPTNFPIDPSANFPSRAIVDKKMLHLPDWSLIDLPEHEKKIRKRFGTNSALYLPLLRDGECIGLLTLVGKRPNTFGAAEIAQAESFRDQALIAIENVRLFEAEQQRTRELSESLEQQTATSEVLQVISSSPGDLEPVFATMVENAVRICHAQWGNIHRWDGETLHLVASHNVPPGYDAFRRSNPHYRPHPKALFGRLLATQAVTQIADGAAVEAYAERLDPIHVAAVELGGARTALGVPMLKENQLIGALSLVRQEVCPFSDKQIAVVKNFAAQAVIAIENARLLNELRQRTSDLSEALEQQTATGEILASITGSIADTKPVFDAIVRNLRRLFGTRLAHVQLLKDQTVYLAAADVDEVEILGKQFPRPLDENSGGGRAMISKQVLQFVLGDPAAPPLMQQFASELGLNAAIFAPMIRGDKVIGAIATARREAKAFNEKQVALIKAFADQAVIAIENARLLNELRQRTQDLTELLEQQTATSEVLKIISSSPGELDPVFQAMLENAIRICEAKFGHLILFEGDLCRIAAAVNMPPALAKAFGQHGIFEPTPGSHLDRLRQTKQVSHTADDTAEAVQGFAAKYGGARSVIAVPMLRDDMLVGAILIYRQEVRPFTDKQIELVKNFAAQAVIAIENTRLLNELRQRTDDLTELLEQQTATSDVLRVISNSPADIQPVFETIGERAEKLCNAEISGVSIVDGELIRRVSVHGMTEAAVEASRRAFPMRLTDETVTARAIRTRSVCHVADVLSDPQYQLTDTARISGFRGCLGVPMVRDEQVVGAIFVARRQPGLFSDTQVQLLKTFADQAVIAIENVRLFKETKISLEQQTATADVLKIISRSTFDLRTVLQTLLESAARFCGADKASIIREKDGVFYAAEAYGYSRDFLEYMKNIPIKAERGSASGRALVEGRVVHIVDVAADPEYTLVEAARLGDFCTILCVPMLREGVAIGLLVLTRSEVQPFTHEQIELVTTFADQAAIAIENVRLFEAEQQRTRELANSLEDLRTTQDRLVQTQKLASLGQLTAGIAHEIKNPLNFVNNFSGVSAELLDELREAVNRMTGDDKTRAEITELADTLLDNLHKIVQHGKRADAIVKNMLLHSREGSGEHRPVDVNALVEESLNLAYHGARAEKQGFNITMERSFDPAAGEIDVFPQEITRVLLNLISNGFYSATKRKGQINSERYDPTLRAATKDLGDSVEIRIRDNGIGISPEVREKMFNPFFTTKPAGEGTGLGLSLSHDIVVKQHGGSIEVDTLPGEFTEFKIILPRVAAFAAQSGERA